MNKLKKAGAAIAASGALIAGPSFVGAPAASAEAASWLPTKPATKQPVGWGSTCAIVSHRYWWGGRYMMEHRWFTTSLGTVGCLEYRVY